ncbi:MAG: Panacea domain-containing protein [Streptosporangiaceae bacterium]
MQKLCYFAYGYHLAWEERPLFPERFQAWANGPVCYELYKLHRGSFRLNPGDIPGDPGQLDVGELESVDLVLDAYGLRARLCPRMCRAGYRPLRLAGQRDRPRSPGAQPPLRPSRCRSGRPSGHDAEPRPPARPRSAVRIRSGTILVHPARIEHGCGKSKPASLVTYGNAVPYRTEGTSPGGFSRPPPTSW